MSYTLANQSGSGITATIEIPLKNAGAPGALIIYNNSQVALTVDDTEGNLYVLPNSTADIYAISQGVSRFRLTAFYNVVGGLNNPDTISFQVLNLADLKKQTRQFPIPLGANSGVATVTNIQNDGNVAGTTFVEATPSGGPQGVKLTNDGNLTVGSLANLNHLSVGTANQFQINTSGVVSFVGNQSTVGSFGVPVICAQVLNFNVTTTSDLAMVTLPPAQAGLYRASITAALGGSGSASIKAYVAYHDPNLGGNVNGFMFGGDSVATAVLGPGTLTKGRVVQIPSITFWADATTNIVIHYQDSTAAVNDWVSAFLERLS